MLLKYHRIEISIGIVSSFNGVRRGVYPRREVWREARNDRRVIVDPASRRSHPRLCGAVRLLQIDATGRW